MQEHLKAVKAEYKRLVAAGKNPGRAAYLALESLNGPVSHGTEAIRRSGRLATVFYANMGETYATTILAYVSSDLFGRESARFTLGTWGGLVESGRYGA
jgi:hypothetical protein